MKSLLLIIDAQKDFCQHTGSLYVPDSEAALDKLCSWIRQNKGSIDDILLTKDSHGYCNICHPAAWTDEKGHIVDPYTRISKKSVESGKYTPRFLDKSYVLEYLDKIEKLGGTHTIWPVHCLQGSEGGSFPDNLIKALSWWSESKNGYQWKIVEKGTRNEAEMYSVFSYADGSKPEIDLLDNIADKGGFDKIYIAGFAKDICVAYSVKDMLKNQKFDGKLVFLDFGMAALNTKSEMLKVYQDAVENHGDSIMKSPEILNYGGCM